MVRLETKIMGINPFWISALLTAAFLIVCATGGDNVNWGYLGFEVLFPFYMAVAVGEWCRIRADQIFDVISAQGKSLFLWIVRRFLVLFVTVTVFAVIGMFGTVIITKTASIGELLKQHAFDSYCKRSIKNEAMNAYTQLRKRSRREVSLSELPEDAMAQLAVYDRYSWEYTTFPVGGAVILIEDDRLAEALLAMSQEDRDIFMMHWFLNMVDREIAEYMNMARRTVNTRRQKAYRLLKELMGGEADD